MADAELEEVSTLLKLNPIGSWDTPCGNPRYASCSLRYRSGGHALRSCSNKGAVEALAETTRKNRESRFSNLPGEMIID